MFFSVGYNEGGERLKNPDILLSDRISGFFHFCKSFSYYALNRVTIISIEHIFTGTVGLHLCQYPKLDCYYFYLSLSHPA